MTAFVASLAAFFLLIRVVGLGGYDLSVYLMGGDAFGQGTPVYDEEISGRYGRGYFTYPPVTLLLFGPLSHLSHSVVHGVMVLVGIAALWAVVWLTMRMVGCRQGPGLVGAACGLTGAALWLQPVFDNLDQGQINLVLLLFVLADFALDGRRRWPTGVLIGLAAAMKITPAIFIVYLLLTRRYRAAVTATATWVVLTAIGFVVARPDSVRFWFGGTFADADRVTSPLTVGSVFNQSIRGIAVRLLGDGFGSAAWYPFAAVVAVGGLAVAVRAYRMVGPVAGLLACAVTGLLISPLTWHEHWVWVVPALIWLSAVAHRMYRRSPIIAGALPCSVGLVFLMWPQPTGLAGQVVPASMLSPARHMWEDDGNHHPLVALAGTAYVSVGLLLLVAGGWYLWRAHRAVQSLDAPSRQGLFVLRPAMASGSFRWESRPRS